MPPEPLTPGTYIDEPDDGPRPISGVSTATTVFIGCAPQGPTETATKIQSFADFERSYGAPQPTCYLGHSVQHFFLNGGKDAHIVRLSNSDDSSSGGSTNDVNAEPFLGQIKSLTVDGSPLHQIDLFNLVCVPGLVDHDALEALSTLCLFRRSMLIVDCSPDARVDELAEGPIQLSAGQNAAFFFPWLKASDASQNDVPRSFPPCGFIAGIIARTDSQRGVWKSPAGVEAGITGVRQPAVVVTDAENGLLNQAGVNCIRTFRGIGNVVWGSRTMAGSDFGTSEWKYIAVRRLTLFIEESIYRGTQWAVFEPNDEPLWAKLRSNINEFMQSLFRDGAFQGRSPREAYFVKCDSTTTAQTDIDAGQVNVLVGFAPLKPAEFVVVTIRQMIGARA